jgi:hypothetical protein
MRRFATGWTFYYSCAVSTHVSPGLHLPRESCAAAERVGASATTPAPPALPGTVERTTVDQGMDEHGTEDADAHRPWPSPAVRRADSR